MSAPPCPATSSTHARARSPSRSGAAPRRRGDGWCRRGRARGTDRRSRGACRAASTARARRAFAQDRFEDLRDVGLDRVEWHALLGKARARLGEIGERHGGPSAATPPRSSRPCRTRRRSRRRRGTPAGCRRSRSRRRRAARTPRAPRGPGRAEPVDHGRLLASAGHEQVAAARRPGEQRLAGPAREQSGDRRIHGIPPARSTCAATSATAGTWPRPRSRAGELGAQRALAGWEIVIARQAIGVLGPPGNAGCSGPSGSAPPTGRDQRAAGGPL